MCGCEVQTCVNSDSICKEPNPFTKEFGRLVFRNERGSGVNTLVAFHGKLDSDSSLKEPNPFTKEFGRLVFRNKRGSGINT